MRVLDTRERVFDTHARVFNTRARVLDIHARVFDTRARVFNTRARVLDTRERVAESRASVCTIPLNPLKKGDLNSGSLGVHTSPVSTSKPCICPPTPQNWGTSDPPHTAQSPPELGDLGG